MPRKAREFIDRPEALYHIVCRGNNKKRIFRRSEDYRRLLNIIRLSKKEFPFYFYSYNFLPNHFHLLVETREFSLSKFMGRVNFLYATYFNHRHNRSGHVFQDRFFSNIIDKEKYFWAVGCYIDLNAVRAGLVQNPKDYFWSSFSIYCQKIYGDDLIDRDKFLSYIGINDLEQARLDYIKFVEGKLCSEDAKTPVFIKSTKMI